MTSPASFATGYTGRSNDGPKGYLAGVFRTEGRGFWATIRVMRGSEARRGCHHLTRKLLAPAASGGLRPNRPVTD